MRKMTTCGGLVLCQGHGLLIRKHGLWDIPKGRRKRRETKERCAVREIAEETGLNANLISVTAPLCDSTYVAYYAGRPVEKTIHWFMLKYAGDLTDVLVPDLGEDIDLCQWIPLRELGHQLRSARPYLQTVARALKARLVMIAS